jgi:hypothetical protein
MIGTGTDGIMSRFLISDFNRTGRDGRVIDIGKRRKRGTSRITNPGHNGRDRN